MASEKQLLAHLNRTRREAVHGETGPDKLQTTFKPFKSLAEAEPDYEAPDNIDVEVVEPKRKSPVA